jgi:hypothetical protein
MSGRLAVALPALAAVLLASLVLLARRRAPAGSSRAAWSAAYASGQAQLSTLRSSARGWLDGSADAVHDALSAFVERRVDAAVRRLGSHTKASPRRSRRSRRRSSTR